MTRAPLRIAAAECPPSAVLEHIRPDTDIIVPLANVLAKNTGNWHAVFYIAAGMNLVAAVMALGVLRPMRMRQMREAGAAMPAAGSRPDGLAPAGD